MDPTRFAKKVFSLVSVVCVTREIVLTLKKRKVKEKLFFEKILRDVKG